MKRSLIFFILVLILSAPSFSAIKLRDEYPITINGGMTSGGSIIGMSVSRIFADYSSIGIQFDTMNITVPSDNDDIKLSGTRTSLILKLAAVHPAFPYTINIALGTDSMMPSDTLEVEDHDYGDSLIQTGFISAGPEIIIDKNWSVGGYLTSFIEGSYWLATFNLGYTL